MSRFLLVSSWRLACFFFFNDTATTETYTLSLHDALPICAAASRIVRPWPNPTSSTRSDGCKASSPSASLLSEAVSIAMTCPRRRPIIPRGRLAWRAINSGRRIGAPAPPISEHGPNSQPIGHTCTHYRARKTNREIVEAGDAASRDHQAETNDNRRNHKSDQRCEIAHLHGPTTFFVESKNLRHRVHFVLSLPTRVQVVVRPTSGIPTYPRKRSRS